MEYKILGATTLSDLAAQVSDSMANRWQPQGGVAVAPVGAGDFVYYQAMIRHNYTAGAMPSIHAAEATVSAN